jgi:hypothetical protein
MKPGEARSAPHRQAEQSQGRLGSSNREDPMTSTLKELVERVAKAEGRDWSLDRAINDALGIDNRYHEHAGYTGSIDAALALCERVLPGWSWMARWVRPDAGGPISVAYVDNAERHHNATAKTPALALLAAMLRALAAAPLPGEEMDGSALPPNSKGIL